MQDGILMKLLMQNSDWPLECDAQALKVVFKTKKKNHRDTTQEALINNQQVNGMQEIIILRRLCISMQFNTALASGEGGHHLKGCPSLCMYANIGRTLFNCHVTSLVKIMPKARTLGVALHNRCGIALEHDIKTLPSISFIRIVPRDL